MNGQRLLYLSTSQPELVFQQGRCKASMCTAGTEPAPAPAPARPRPRATPSSGASAGIKVRHDFKAPTGKKARARSPSASIPSLQPRSKRGGVLWGSGEWSSERSALDARLGDSLRDTWFFNQGKQRGELYNDVRLTHCVLQGSLLEAESSKTLVRCSFGRSFKQQHGCALLSD